jgi:hypothetical protein
LNTADRTPVTTRISTTMPLTSTSPMAAGQDICGAIDTATNALMPSPVAIANG